MAQKPTRIADPQRGRDATSAQFVRVHFKTLEIPPVRDGVVIGRSAAIGSEVMMQTLRLMSGERFVKLDVDDEIVACVLVRESIMKKLEAVAIENFIVRRVKPFMSPSEILALHLAIEIVLEDVL